MPAGTAAGSMASAKVTPRWRKAVLIVHVITAVGWLGTDRVLLTLGAARLNGSDPGR